MYEIIYAWIESSVKFETLAEILTYTVFILGIIIICLIIDKITKSIIIKNIKRIVHKTKTTADEVFYEQKVFHGLSHIAPLLVVYFFANAFGKYSTIIKEVALAVVVIVLCIVSYRAIDSFIIIFGRTEFGKNKPIKGVMQIVKIVLTIIAGLIVFTIFSKTGAATALIASLGGVSAVILLVFQDSILGFVAGVQLSADNLLCIGDWLQMDKYQADGEVIDISLTKITVQNWDKTYVTIPAHKFLQDSFKNWQGMQQSGGRRIKRAMNIDVSSIAFLTEEQINKLSKIQILNGYIQEKVNEVNAYNDQKSVDVSMLANGRRLTNVGMFRAYIEAYLNEHTSIQHEEFTLMVRQLPVGESGLPIELYCFTTTTDWVEYEKIQADIFDHLLAVAPLFGLTIYQKPSGKDVIGLNIAK